MTSRLQTKIDMYFDQLQYFLERREYENADITLAKLSIYYHLFDDELADFYQYAQELVDYELNFE